MATLAEVVAQYRRNRKALVHLQAMIEEACTKAESSLSEDPLPGDRLLRVPEVCKRTGLSRTTLWRLERAGEFPRRRQISTQTVGWLVSDVVEWIKSRRERGAG